MHLVLNNLNDKELLYRIRKLEDREAIGVLLDRYSHLLVAVSLPQLDAKHPPETAFPSLSQLMAGRFQFLNGKVNESIYALIKSYFGKGSKLHTTPYEHKHAQAIQQIEHRVENASSNPIERDKLARQLDEALQKLHTEDRQIVEDFYINHLNFSDIAKTHNSTPEKIRNRLNGAKKKLATQLMYQAYE